MKSISIYMNLWYLSIIVRKAGVNMDKNEKDLTTLSDISLLYPDAQTRSESYQSTSGLPNDSAEQLELYNLIELSSSDIGSFFTTDMQVIQYRQKTFADLTAHSALCDILVRMLPFLYDITELRKMYSDTAVGDSYLYSISEIEIYTSLMSMLQEELLPYKDQVNSPALQNLIERISILTESKYYKNLTEKLNSLASRVRDIRSITIGVNLDARLFPESAGVLSVNSDRFKSGEFFDKVMRLDFKDDDMTCIASLIPFYKGQNENQQMAMMNAFNNALADVFKTSIRSWKRAVQYYVLDNTDFLLHMIPEIEFVTKGTALIRQLQERGCPLCVPEIRNMSEKIFQAKGLCNPVISTKTDSALISNDIIFDNSAMIYVITGPNRGGKSVLTCSVGHAFAMAQLGLPVCAEKAVISPCDYIFTHFPTGSEDTVEKGRLGEECARLDAIFDKVTAHSLVLLDESLSSTGSYEGAYIASEVLSGFSMVGCRLIFSTHLHDLAAAVEQINQTCIPKGGVPIDNMVAEVTEDGQRTFRVIRKKPDGKSYAKDIADKYGLSFAQICKKIHKN
jgi:DNA mismatch repair protein MutS